MHIKIKTGLYTLLLLPGMLTSMQHGQKKKRVLPPKYTLQQGISLLHDEQKDIMQFLGLPKELVIQELPGNILPLRTVTSNGKDSYLYALQKTAGPITPDTRTLLQTYLFPDFTERQNLEYHALSKPVSCEGTAIAWPLTLWNLETRQKVLAFSLGKTAQKSSLLLTTPCIDSENYTILFNDAYRNQHNSLRLLTIPRVSDLCKTHTWEEATALLHNMRKYLYHGQPKTFIQLSKKHQLNLLEKLSITHLELAHDLCNVLADQQIKNEKICRITLTEEQQKIFHDLPEHVQLLLRRTCIKNYNAYINAE